MTMRDLVNAIAFANSVTPQTIAGADLTGIGVDLAGFGSATVVLVLGDIDELGGSPVGSAKIDLRLQHSDDNASWSDVTDADVIGLSGVTAVTNGVAASTTGDAVPVDVGYVGDRRYLRAILQPSGLSNGGPAGAIVIKGHPRHAPA
jgi:hypothetical protein